MTTSSRHRAAPAALGRALRLVLGRVRPTPPDGPATARDAGIVTAAMLGLVTIMLAIAAVAYDLTDALGDRQRATDIAEQAARQGADAITPSTGTRGQVAPAAATAAAQRYLHSVHVAGTVEVSNNQVTVHVTLEHPTSLVAVVGINSITLHATGTARPLPGLETAG